MSLKRKISDLEYSANKLIKNRLDFTFFDQYCLTLSEALLGKILVRRDDSTGTLIRCKIVEVEAYLGGTDKASHSYGYKRTEKNEAMYMPPGTCYVYNIYGIYCCMNISSKEPGGGVLIRALEPIEGVDCMKLNRKIIKDKFKLAELTSGPSRLCQALNITKDKFNKVDLVTSNLLWLEDTTEELIIGTAKRINIDYAGEEAINKLYRFFIRENQFVSGPKKALK
jgi:DNA-3-methyladenine glycosylase